MSDNKSNLNLKGFFSPPKTLPKSFFSGVQPKPTVVPQEPIVEPEKEKEYEEPPEDDPTDDVSDKESLDGWIEKKVDTKPKDIVEKIVDKLDDMRYQTEVKEELDEIEKLKNEFASFKRKIAKDLSSSSGGGAGSFAQLDDVNATSAKVDGKIIQFDGSSGKFVGSDFVAAASALTGTTLASGITASSLTSVGTLTSLTVDNISINGTTIGHTDDTDLITLADGLVTIAGNLTVSGTTTTVNQTVVNVTDAFIFEGANADAHETTFRVDEPTADRKASLQDKTGTIALLSGFRIDATDSSASNEGDFIVLDTSADENDRLLFEDGTSDPIAVLASHGITLSGQGWNAFQFENP